MKFTKQNINKLEPQKNRYIVIDDSTQNFGIKVYPSGKKSYIVKVKSAGKTKEYTISECSLVPITKARKMAGDIIEQYKKGIDVKQAEKQEDVEKKTLESCIDEYIPTVKAKTQEDILKCKTNWDNWLKKPIRNITPLMVLKAYDKRVKESRHRARLEAAYLRSIWNYFKKSLNLDDSPTLILNEERKGWSSKTTNHRRLDHETASGWHEAIQKISDRDRSMFQLVYYTGLRAGEAMAIEWKNINFKNNSLHIPDTKNGKPLDIPLNSYAIDILKAIRGGKYKHRKYIFPQVGRDGKVSEMKSYSKSLTLLKKQGVMWSPHDSRRGFINAGGVTGCNSYMVKQLVNHAESGTEAHGGYHYYTLAELRPTTQTIGDYLNNQLHSSNVVKFKMQV